jgi:hypothetical protein
MKDEIAGTIYAKEYTDWHIKTGGFARDMTLRDHFAATVIQGHFVRHGWGSDQEHFEDVAQGAYRMADAMLKERAK